MLPETMVLRLQQQTADIKVKVKLSAALPPKKRQLSGWWCMCPSSYCAHVIDWTDKTKIVLKPPAPPPKIIPAHDDDQPHPVGYDEDDDDNFDNLDDEADEPPRKKAKLAKEARSDSDYDEMADLGE